MAKSTVDRTRPPATLIRGRAPATRWLARAAQLAALILVLFLAWRLLEQIGWRDLSLRMRSARQPLMIAASAALLARFVLLYLRWHLALESAHFRPPWLYGLASQLAAVLANHLTPTARLLGGVFRARCVSRKILQPFAQVYATVLVDQISQQVVFGTVTWLALIAVSEWMGLVRLARVLGLSLVTVVVALTIWRQRRMTENSRPLATLVGLKAERLGRRLGPLFAGGRELVAVLRQSFSDIRLQARMAALGLLILLLNVLAQWWIFESLGTPVRLGTVAATIALGIAAGLLTGTPGGIATTEAAMVGLYVSLGVDRVDAVAGVLLYRGIHYLLVLTLGVPAMVYCEMSSGSAPEATDGLSGGAPRGSESPADESPRDPGA